MNLHTLHAAKWIFSLILLTGCSVFQELERPPYPEPTFGPRSQVFYAPKAKVWRALQLSIQQYPLQSNDVDRGFIETEMIGSDIGWQSPHKVGEPHSGRKYSLRIRVIEGKVKGEPAIKVSILKEISFKKDFFSKSKKMPSDGLEEKSILYRTKRELKLDEAIEKLAAE